MFFQSLFRRPLGPIEFHYRGHRLSRFRHVQQTCLHSGRRQCQRLRHLHHRNSVQSGFRLVHVHHQLLLRIPAYTSRCPPRPVSAQKPASPHGLRASGRPNSARRPRQPASGEPEARAEPPIPGCERRRHRRCGPVRGAAAARWRGSVWCAVRPAADSPGGPLVRLAAQVVMADQAVKSWKAPMCPRRSDSSPPQAGGSGTCRGSAPRGVVCSRGVPAGMLTMTWNSLFVCRRAASSPAPPSGHQQTSQQEKQRHYAEERPPIARGTSRECMARR